MNTPVADFIRNYSESGTARFHMPGHKGKVFLGPEALDITEVDGADELYVPEGIILEGERNTARLFGTGVSAWSVEGSSHAIRSMITLVCQHRRTAEEKPLILAARNAHKAFLYACAVCDAGIEWLYPSENAENSAAACQPSAEAVREKLAEMKREDRLPDAVYVTSPDYLGQTADLKTMAETVHAYGILFLVDNAHGAYLKFLPESMHPMNLGADLCADSAHKTLPVLTGGAYLHVRKGLFSYDEVKAAMEITGTTSPSYLIMASMDLANRYMAEVFPDRLKKVIAWTEAVKTHLKEAGLPVSPGESLKIVIRAAEMGFTGEQLGNFLRERRIEPEFCDIDYLVLMVSAENTEEELKKLEAALMAAAAEKRSPLHTVSVRLKPLEKVLSPRQALFALHETVPVDAAAGRILGAPAVSCPPAVPIAVSGERITEDTVRIMKLYGMRQVQVVAE